MDQITKSQRLLVGHGALVLMVGFIAGFGFLFFLLGDIRLWPIPGVIDYQLPGTYDAWRMAHLEGILNGFSLWILAAVLPLFQFSDKGTRRVAIGMIITSWTIAIASCFDPLLQEARGLALTETSNLMNDIAFLLFVVGILIVMVIVATIAVRCLGQPGSSAAQ